MTVANQSFRHTRLCFSVLHRALGKPTTAFRQLWLSPFQSHCALRRGGSICAMQRAQVAHLIVLSSLSSLSGNTQTLHTITATQKALDPSVASLKQRWRESAVSLWHNSFIFDHLFDKTLICELMVVNVS